MGPIDRISALPNEVVGYILSLMPTKFAVRTTVLSKRWNNKWTCVPNLDFSDLRDFCADYQGSDRFATFVSRVLYFRDSVDIPKCSLLLFSPHDLSRVDDWVCAIVRRNVVEFEFSFDICVETGESPFPIPRSFLMCKTLRVLKLNLWASDFTIDPPASGCFPRLKVLHLRVCSDNVPLMEKLYSCCPVLEVLTIEGIMDLGDADDGVVYDFKISALELKTLRIDFVCQNYNTRLDVYNFI